MLVRVKRKFDVNSMHRAGHNHCCEYKNQINPVNDMEQPKRKCGTRGGTWAGPEVLKVLVDHELRYRTGRRHTDSTVSREP